MNDKEIKTIFESVLMERGFKKTRYIYVRDFGSFLFRVNLQRSLGGEDYYFNCYFLLKEIHEPEALASFVIADVTGRQHFNIDGKYTEFIRIENLDYDYAKYIIVLAVDELLSLVESEGIKGYLKKYPDAINSAPSGSRAFLEKEGYINTEEKN